MNEGGGGEKTEKATPRKREEARKEGRVLKSNELNIGVLMISLFAVLGLSGGFITGQWRRLLEIFLGGNYFSPDRLTPALVGQMWFTALIGFSLAILPMAATAVLVGLVVNFAQVGFLFTAKPLMPKFSKINPIQGFKKIFSMRSIVELLKSLFKIAVIGFFVYQAYRNNFMIFSNLMGGELQDVAMAIFQMCFDLAIRAAIALVVLGLADYIYQWYDYEKNLRMSKHEVKQEYKQTEGDPLIKSKIRQKQREIAQSRMMSAVPQADVVITNPTHYAVALKYDEAVADAPVVLAKGQNLIAQRIKELAREHRVPVVENKPVAQALFLTAEVGQRIPAELFGAVAEILAYVFRLRNPGAYATQPPRRADGASPPLAGGATRGNPQQRGDPAMSNVRGMRM
jgi:flagellar biosynthetic protein FlhB